MQPLYLAMYLKKLNQKKGKKFADNVLNIINICSFFIILIVEIFTPYLVYLIAPGFFETIINLILLLSLQE